MNIRTSLTPLILVLMAAAGCSLSNAAIPDGNPGSSVPPSSQTSPTSGTAPPTGLTAIGACDLLTGQEASSLNVPSQGRPDEIVGLRSCSWTTPEGVVSTSIDEESGIDELNLSDASNVTDVTIGSHRAKRAVEGSGPGYCDVFFAVGDTASVGVSALYLNDTQRACAVADQAAALVEPKLP